jgi:PAS domain S-box-containing protein
MQWSATQRVSLDELLRRAEEVRGLAPEAGASAPASSDEAGSLLHLIDELVQELERSHRRLIETNVQLVSLREVASRLLGTLDAFETTGLVTRYLCQVHGFPECFLLLIQRDQGRLQGTWTHFSDQRECNVRLDLPLTGDGGTISRALWFNRTVVHHRPRRHAPVVLPDGHSLGDVLDGLGSTLCVPLFRSHGILPASESHELCGSRCILGDPGLLAPAPSSHAPAWNSEREERQQHCLRCDVFPLLGVIGMARRKGQPPIGAADVQMLESIAQSVAPMVENARLIQDLRRSERFRLHVLDSMTSALVAVNMRGEILSVNRGAKALLSVPESQVHGQPFGMLFGSDGEAALRSTLERGQEVEGLETVLPARDGTMIPIRLSTSLLRDERRVVYGAIVTFADLTPIRQAEERARQLDRLATLGRFTSSVAHEIRNPLTGIGTGVQYLAAGVPDTDPRQESVKFIHHEIQRLDRIVQDLFDATHPRGLQFQVAPLEDTVGRAARCVASLYEKGGVELEIQTAPGTPPVAHDADQIEQAFINLLKNAAEASSAGTKVTVTIAPKAAVRTAAGPTKPHGRRSAASAASPGIAHAVITTIEDQGAGIRAEDLPTLFEPFVTTKKSGTGLGLYVTHDIIKRHGGQLVVASEPGRGSQFTLELPVAPHGGTS